MADGGSCEEPRGRRGLAFDSGPFAWQGSRPSRIAATQKVSVLGQSRTGRKADLPHLPRASSTISAAGPRSAPSAGPSSTPKRPCETAGCAPARRRADYEGRGREAARARRRAATASRTRSTKPPRWTKRPPSRSRSPTRTARRPKAASRPPGEDLGVDFAEEEELEEESRRRSLPRGRRRGRQLRGRDRGPARATSRTELAARGERDRPDLIGGRAPHRVRRLRGTGLPAEPGIRGYSSAGRALEWHSRGQRFDSA